MVYEELIDDILQIGTLKPEDYWRDKHQVPLFSKKVFRDYDEGKISDDETLTLDIDTRDAQSRNPFNALVCASTGVGKTRLVKNIIKGFMKADYNILYIEPKSLEMLNAKRKGIGKRLHPMDKNESLDVVSYAPRYIKSFLERNFPEMLTKTKFYSPEVKLMDYREIWQSFGIPNKAADMIVECVQKGHTNLKYFEKIIGGSRMMSNTKSAAIAALDNLQGTGFFATTKKLNLRKEWEDKKGVVVN